MKIGSYDLRDLRTMIVRKLPRLGVEVQPRVVRIVNIRKLPDGRLKIVSFGSIDVDIQHAGVLEQQRFKAAVAQLGSGLKRAAVNIEHPTFRVRRMNFAPMPDPDLMEAIRWNFREQVEVPMEKYAVSFVRLDEFSDDSRLALMAYGVSEDAITAVVDLFKGHGVKLISLEPSATAILASFCANKILLDGKFHVCLSLGESYSEFLILKGESMIFSRPLAGISSEGFQGLLGRNLNITGQKAGELIAMWMDSAKNGGAAAGTADPQMKQVEMTMSHFLSQLVIETQRSIDAFCIMYNIEKADIIHVCGAGVRIPGIVEHVEKSLGVRTEVFNPFALLMEKERQTADVLAQAPLFATAAGLAIP